MRTGAAGEILSPTETEILRLLREARGEVTGERLAADLGLREPSRAVARLIRWGIVASDEHGRRRVGETLETIVTTVLQTSAGRMIFGRVKGEEPRAV